MPSGFPRSFRSASWHAAALACWVVALTFGWSTMLTYGFQRDGDAQAQPPATWPTDSGLTRHGDRPTLLIFVHPRCPCTQATISELERILAVLRHGQGEKSTRPCIVATVPRHAARDWTKSSLLNRCSRLPGVTIRFDLDGAEANRFFVRTSGTVLLYDEAGSLRYAGGITAARGHEGANAGRDALARVLDGRTPTGAATPAFGCRLVLPLDRASIEDTVTGRTPIATKCSRPPSAPRSLRGGAS